MGARQIAKYHLRLRELPPVYDSCPTRCIAPNRDPANGCPECEVTNAYREFEKAYLRQLEFDLRQGLEREGGRSSKAIGLIVANQLQDTRYPFELIVEYIGELLELESMSGGEEAHNPDWNVRTAKAIRILRTERAKVRREHLYDATEAAKAEARAASLRRGHPNG